MSWESHNLLDFFLLINDNMVDLWFDWLVERLDNWGLSLRLDSNPNGLLLGDLGLLLKVSSGHLDEGTGLAGVWKNKRNLVHFFRA